MSEEGGLGEALRHDGETAGGNPLAPPEAPGSPKEALSFTINAKVYSYKGKLGLRERDFFQLYIKAMKGKHSLESALVCFRENIPDSDMSEEELKQLYLRHEKRRADRDAARGQKKSQRDSQEESEPAPTPPGPLLSDDGGSGTWLQRCAVPKHAPPPPPPLSSRHSTPQAAPVVQPAGESPLERRSLEDFSLSLGNCRETPDVLVVDSGPAVVQGGGGGGGGGGAELPVSPVVAGLDRVMGVSHLMSSDSSCANKVATPQSPGFADMPGMRAAGVGSFGGLEANGEERQAVLPVATPALSPPLPSGAPPRRAEGDVMSRESVSLSADAKGWAADPVPREHTAWERELMRRRERAERAAKCPSQASTTNLPPNIQSGQSVSISSDSAVPQPQHSQSPRMNTPSSESGSRLRSSRSDVKKQSKERRKDRRDSDLQKMMMELLHKTSEIQGRIAHLETRDGVAMQDVVSAATGMTGVTQSLNQLVSSQPGIRSGWGTGASHESPSVRRGSSVDGSLHSAFSSLPRGLQQHTTTTSTSSADAEILTLVKLNEQGSTLLHEMSAKGLMEEVNKLVLMGADVEARDRFSRTPLAVASCAGHLPVIHILSSKGINMEAADARGATAVMLAAAGNHISTVEYLTLRGALLSSVDLLGRGVLHYAVGPQPDALRCLLASQEVDINKRDHSAGRAPLHYAAVGGFTECVKTLLSAGAAMMHDYFGDGPLALAATAGFRDTVSEFVTHTSSLRDWQPLHEQALLGGNLRTVLLTSAKSRGARGSVGQASEESKHDNPVHHSTTIHVKGEDEAAREACNERDILGHTPLHLAVVCADVANVEFLLLRGSEVSLRDVMGRTPLHLAASRGNHTLCKVLVQAGAAIDVEDVFRLTPYNAALLHGHTACAKFLCQVGADHLLPDSVHRLDEVVRRQCPSVCPLLVLAYRRAVRSARIAECIGASQNTTNWMEGLEEFTRPTGPSFLYTHGANPVAPAAPGQPLGIDAPSSRTGKRPALSCLLDTDLHGRTALMMSALVGDDDGVAYLLSVFSNAVLSAVAPVRGAGPDAAPNPTSAVNSVAEALLRHCSPFICDNRGWTALHYAVARDQIHFTRDTPSATVRPSHEAPSVLDVSSLCLTPSQMAGIDMTFSAKKTSAMSSIVLMLVQKACATGCADPRTIRAVDGRLPADVAKDEACPPLIQAMLRPGDPSLCCCSATPAPVAALPPQLTEDAACPAPLKALTRPVGDTGTSQSLYWGLRYVAVLVASVVSGVFLIPCFCLYYIARGQPMTSVLSQPHLVMLDHAAALLRSMRQRLRGEEGLYYASRRGGRIRRNLSLLCVLFAIVSIGLLSFFIVESNTWDKRRGMTPAPPPLVPGDTPLPAGRDAGVAGDEHPDENLTEGTLGAPSATATLTASHTDTGTATETGTGTGTHQGWVPEDVTRTQRSLAIRFGVLGYAGAVTLAMLALLTRRVLVGQREGHYRVPAISRRVDFRIWGNAAMLVLTVADATMLSSLPFMMVYDTVAAREALRPDMTPMPTAASSDTDPSSTDVHPLTLAMRYAVLEGLHPTTAFTIAACVVLVWLTLVGFAALTSSVSTSDAIRRKVGVLQPHTMKHVPPYLVHLLSHTLFLPVNVATLRAYKCVDYSADNGPFIVGYHGSISCYEGAQSTFAGLGLVLLFLYNITSGCVGGLLSAPKGGVCDIAWGYPLLCAEKTAYVALAFIATLFFDQEWAATGMFFFTASLLILYVGRVDDRSPYLPSLLQWRMLGYVYSLLALAAVSFFLRGDGVAPAQVGVILLACSFALLVVVAAVLHSYSLRRMQATDRVEAFRRLAIKPVGPESGVAAPEAGPPISSALNANDLASHAHSLSQLPPVPSLQNAVSAGASISLEASGEAAVQDNPTHPSNASSSGGHNGTNRSGGNNSQGRMSIGKPASVVLEPDGWVLVGLGEPSTQCPLVV